VETLYQTTWAGSGCGAIAAQVGLIALAACAATAILIGVIVRVAMRRLPGSRRAVWWLLSVSGLIVLGVIAATLVSGTTTHRISVTGSGLVFERCNGLTPVTEAVAFEEIVDAAYRSRLGGGRSARPIDEVVLTLRMPGEARIIPLSTDPATLDPAMLRRVVPAPVIEAYREALGRRGVAVPSGL
jgi:hypothetical protein